jgi:hypothetical protein
VHWSVDRVLAAALCETNGSAIVLSALDSKLPKVGPTAIVTAAKTTPTTFPP